MESIERRSSESKCQNRRRFGWLHRSRTVAGSGFNRWLVPPAALAIHLSIGMAYGFSVFWLPLSKALPGVATCGARVSWFDQLTASCNWRVQSVSVTFVLFTVVLGLAAAVWGKWVERVGPRKSSAVSALFWCGGLALGALAIQIHQLWLLWLGTGIIGGVGLGIGYISPVSTLIRWFPDRRGMATGMAIMGFGGGAMIGAPLAVVLMKYFQTPASPGVAATFMCLAAIYGVFMLGGAFTYRLPPRSWRPAGWTPPQKDSNAQNRSVHVSQAWKSRAFWCVWGVLAMNVSAGIGVLSMASPLLQEIFGGRLIGLDVGVSALSADQRAECAVIGVGFTGLLSLFNIGGRFVWAVLSDRIGRKNTFHCIFLLGIPLYAFMPTLSTHDNLILFVAGLCVLMSMFGGAFAVVPAYLSDLFGSEMISAIQGRVLTAWSTAGVIGPLLIGAIRDSRLGNGVDLAHAYDPAFYVIAGLLLIGLVCNALVRPVPDHYFMSSEELERHRHGSRYKGPETRNAENTVEIGLTLTAPVASAWLMVCIPIGWGICMTVARAAVLL